MTNHTGGTEVRGSVEATTSTEGYTGDHCKGCNTKLADGKTIPKKTAAPVAVAAPAAAARWHIRRQQLRWHIRRHWQWQLWW